MGSHSVHPLPKYPAGEHFTPSEIGAEKTLLYQRRRIKTEEKVNVVAAVWGTEYRFLATLAILHKDYFEE